MLRVLLTERVFHLVHEPGYPYALKHHPGIHHFAVLESDGVPLVQIVPVLLLLRQVHEVQIILFLKLLEEGDLCVVLMLVGNSLDSPELEVLDVLYQILLEQDDFFLLEIPVASPKHVVFVGEDLLV